MTKHHDDLEELAKLTLDNSETAAQLEIKDSVLRQSLLDNIRVALLKAYNMSRDNA